MDEKLLSLFTSKEAQDPFCAIHGDASRVRQAPNQHNTQQTRVLIIAIDDARALLPAENSGESIGWISCFRCALDKANNQLAHKYGAYSGVLGIVVDTDPAIANFVPLSLQPDPSQCEIVTNDVYSPFVLTGTIDIFQNNGQHGTIQERVHQYKEEVYAAVAHAMLGTSARLETIVVDNYHNLVDHSGRLVVNHNYTSVALPPNNLLVVCRHCPTSAFEMGSMDLHR